MKDEDVIRKQRYNGVFIAVLAVGSLAGMINAGVASDNGIQVCDYRGIHPTDSEGRRGLRNPERGFRWENRFASTLDKWQPEQWIGSILEFAEDDGLTMTQAYVELIDYHDQPRLPDEVLGRLQRDFDAVREAGLKLLLCFRYEMDRESDKGPTLDIILSHIDQLAPILRKNMDVIAVLQTGFVGLYGEWHRSVHGLDRDEAAQEKIISALLDVLPTDRRMVLRYPRHKDAYIRRVTGATAYKPITAALAESATQHPAYRIGFADHGFMVGENDAGTFPPRPSEVYDYMTQESLFVPMDAELFWASSHYGQLKDNGLEAIRRLWEHHYDLFSYTHNHSRYEGWRWKQERDARYSIDEWKEESLDPTYLEENHLPISDGYFEDEQGNAVSRSIFEYIRDHLGYRIELQRARFPDAARPGDAVRLEVEFVNRGFAAPMNPRPVQFVLIDGEGSVVESPVVDGDARQWYPCQPRNRTKLAPVHRWELTFKLDENIEPGNYRLGVWLPDASSQLRYVPLYAIRVANGNVPWHTTPDSRYGVNLLGEIRVTEGAGQSETHADE